MKQIFILSLLILSNVALADVDIAPNASATCDAGVIGASNGSVLLRANYELASYDCASGYFLPADGIACAACPNGYTCAGGTYSFNETKSSGALRNTTIMNTNEAKMCGANYEHKIYANLTPRSVTCNAGTYLPANSLNCATCPNGYTCAGGTYSFNETKSSGALRNTTIMNTNEAKMCGANYEHKIYANLTPVQVVCNSGYFLPANSLNCAACPNGYTCAGGTYSFNETKSSGALRNTTIMNANEAKMCGANYEHKIYATFTLRSVTCSAGTYLPANSVNCAPCPVNNYCLGGTFTFNETNSSGETECPSGLFAPGGWSYCTHLFWVGDKSIYLRTTPQTTPSLHIDIDNDSVADYFANATTTPVPMTAASANETSNNKLVIEIPNDYIYNGTTIHAGRYYIYDDTVNVYGQ